MWSRKDGTSKLLAVGSPHVPTRFAPSLTLSLNSSPLLILPIQTGLSAISQHQACSCFKSLCTCYSSRHLHGWNGFSLECFSSRCLHGWLLHLLPVSLNVTFSKGLWPPFMAILWPPYSKLWLYPPLLLFKINFFPKYYLLSLLLLIILLFTASLLPLQYVSLGQGVLFLLPIHMSQVPGKLVSTQ